MLYVILATIYCTLMYVAGYQLFHTKIGATKFAALLLWILSPLSVPFMLLILLAAG